jgi:hypothetical protein
MNIKNAKYHFKVMPSPTNARDGITLQFGEDEKTGTICLVHGKDY